MMRLARVLDGPSLTRRPRWQGAVILAGAAALVVPAIGGCGADGVGPLPCINGSCEEQLGGTSCTPSCADRCGGAPDGCGSYCPQAACAGCCASDGACVAAAAQTSTHCGAGGEMCHACDAPDPPCTPACGGKCGGAADGCGGLCPNVACAGCCASDGACVAAAAQTEDLCGTAGEACHACNGSGETCTPDCAGKCGGTPDGCGGSCPDVANAGCCTQAGQCNCSNLPGITGPTTSLDWDFNVQQHKRFDAMSDEVPYLAAHGATVVRLRMPTELPESHCCAGRASLVDVVGNQRWLMTLSESPCVFYDDSAALTYGISTVHFPAALTLGGTYYITVTNHLYQVGQGPNLPPGCRFLDGEWLQDCSPVFIEVDGPH